MKNLLGRTSSDETVVKITKGLSENYPEHFKYIIVFNENKMLYCNHEYLPYVEGAYLKMIKEQFDEDPNIAAFTDTTYADFDIGDGKDKEKYKLDYGIIASRTINAFTKKPFSNKELSFSLLHEMVHINDKITHKYPGDYHLNECYADVGAYFLYLKEVSPDYKFLGSRIYESAITLSQKNYGEYGTNYTANAMLVAANVAQQIEIPQLNIEQVFNLSSTIAEEFALPNKTREYLYKSFCDEKGYFSISKVLDESMTTTDSSVFITGRQISLSQYFNDKAFTNRRDAAMVRKMFAYKNSLMKIPADPLIYKSEKGIPSATQEKVNSLIKENPEIKRKKPIQKIINGFN